MGNDNTSTSKSRLAIVSRFVWRKSNRRTSCHRIFLCTFCMKMSIYLILAKDAGIIVHPTHGHYMNTIANGVVYHWQQAGITCRFRPVHRLDQETSGVLAIAKTPYVHQQISEQMIRHQVKKEYLAFVWGIVASKSGTINEPIDRDPE